jgi:hypothetical protein
MPRVRITESATLVMAEYVFRSCSGASIGVNRRHGPGTRLMHDINDSI